MKARLLLCLLPCLLVALALTGCSLPAVTPPSAEPSTTTSTDVTETPAEAVVVRRPVRNGCHRLSFAQAVAPVVGGTDVDCRMRHTSQTYKIGRLPLVSDGHLRAVDSASVQSFVASTCTSLLSRHVGGTPEQLRLSMIRPVWFTPSVEEAAAGADWFRCDVLALAAPGRLSALPRSSRGLLGSSDAFRMCGTAPPDAAGHRRVPCSAQHSWVALATVDLPGETYPTAAAAGDVMEAACRDAARDTADDPLDFTWSEERPSRAQWRTGQRYGICWVPA